MGAGRVPRCLVCGLPFKIWRRRFSGAAWGLETAVFALCSHHGRVVPGLQGGGEGVQTVAGGTPPPLNSAGASLLYEKVSGPANEGP